MMEQIRRDIRDFKTKKNLDKVRHLLLFRSLDMIFPLPVRTSSMCDSYPSNQLLHVVLESLGHKLSYVLSSVVVVVFP